jgi:hypothetical protein
MNSANDDLPLPTPFSEGWILQWDWVTGGYVYLYNDNRLSSWNIKAENVFNELSTEVLKTKQAIESAKQVGMAATRSNLENLTEYFNLVQTFERKGLEIQRHYQEEVEQFLARVKFHSHRVRHSCAIGRSVDLSDHPITSIPFPSSEIFVHESIDVSSNLVPPQDETKSQTPVSLVGKPNESTSDQIVAKAVQQGVSRDATRAVPIAMQEQDLHTNALNHPTASALGASRKKIPLVKDPSKFKHKCKNCDKCFTRSTTLREHERIHSSERPFLCETCSKGFVRLKDRNRHQALHGGEKKYRCGSAWDDLVWGCYRSFAREDQLAAHLRTERGWTCLQSLLENLKDHFWRWAELKAGNRGRLVCILTQYGCQATLGGIADFKSHLKDPANRACVAEYLVQSVLTSSRAERYFEEEPSPTPSASEEQPPSTVRQPSPKIQPAKSRPPSPEAGRPRSSTIRDSFPEIGKLSLGSTGEDHKVEGRPEIEKVANEARQPANPQPEAESNLDSDPFAGWVVVSSRYEDHPYADFLSVDIRVPKHLTAHFYFRIQDSKGLNITEQKASVGFLVSRPGSYRFWVCGLRVSDFVGEDVLVDLCCYEITQKSFHVGTLRCKVIGTGKEWVLDSSA